MWVLVGQYRRANPKHTCVSCACGLPVDISSCDCSMNPLPDWLLEKFPRAARYNFEWQKENSFGGNPVWLAEWLTNDLPLNPGMKALDLGCGRGKSSIFLAREFGVQIVAVDLMIDPAETLQRIRHAGLEGQILPLCCDARQLPFAAEAFDAIVCLDAYFYFGTDDLYLNYLCNFVRPGGWLGIAGAGLTEEITGEVPAHLLENWSNDYWALHSAPWQRRLWEKTGLVDIVAADAMPEGGRAWLEWQQRAHPYNQKEIVSLEIDAGRWITYTRVIARRRPGVKLEEYCWPSQRRVLPMQFDPLPIEAESQ